MTDRPLVSPFTPAHAPPPTQRRVRVRLSYGDCRLIGLLSLNLCRAPYLHVNFAYLVWSDLYTVVNREYLLPQNYCEISPKEHREVSTQVVNKRRELDFTNSTTFRTILREHFQYYSECFYVLNYCTIWNVKIWLIENCYILTQIKLETVIDKLSLLISPEI